MHPRCLSSTATAPRRVVGCSHGAESTATSRLVSGRPSGVLLALSHSRSKHVPERQGHERTTRAYRFTNAPVKLALRRALREAARLTSTILDSAECGPSTDRFATQRNFRVWRGPSISERGIDRCLSDHRCPRRSQVLNARLEMLMLSSTWSAMRGNANVALRATMLVLPCDVS